MKNPLSSIYSPKHGILVLDTNALVEMCVPLPEALISPDVSERPVRMTTMLEFLAKNGYQILIPELVAYECGGWLHEYEAAQDMVVQERDLFHPLTADFMHSIKHLQKEGADIHIVGSMPKDGSAHAQHLRTCNHIRQSQSSPEEKREQYQLLWNHFKKNLSGTGAGEKAAFLLIRALRDPEIPIFFVTRDKDAATIATTIRDDMDIHQLNPLGIYHALNEQELLPHLPVASVGLNVFREHFTKAIESIDHHTPGLYPCIDRDSYHQGQFPFYNSLAKLRQALHPDAILHEEETTIEPFADPLPLSPTFQVAASQHQGKPQPLTTPAIKIPGSAR